MGHVSILLDEMGLDKMGLDEMGLDKMGINQPPQHTHTPNSTCGQNPQAKTIYISIIDISCVLTTH